MKLGVLGYIKDLAQGKTLMLHRIKKKNDIHEGKWNGLGGKLEPGESPEEALHREILEESGLTIANPKLRGIITFPKFDEVDDWYVYVFTVYKFEGTLIDCPEGELDWISDDKIKTLPLWEGDYLFLDWLDQKSFFSAKMIYRNKKLIHHQVNFY